MPSAPQQQFVQACPAAPAAPIEGAAAPTEVAKLAAEAEVPRALSEARRVNAEMLAVANANVELLARAVAEAEAAAKEAAMREESGICNSARSSVGSGRSCGGGARSQHLSYVVGSPGAAGLRPAEEESDITMSPDRRAVCRGDSAPGLGLQARSACHPDSARDVIAEVRVSTWEANQANSSCDSGRPAGRPEASRVPPPPSSIAECLTPKGAELWSLLSSERERIASLAGGHVYPRSADGGHAAAPSSGAPSGAASPPGAAAASALLLAIAEVPPLPALAEEVGGEGPALGGRKGNELNIGTLPPPPPPPPLPPLESSVDANVECIRELRAQLQDRERQAEEERLAWQHERRGYQQAEEEWRSWQEERDRLYAELRDAQRSSSSGCASPLCRSGDSFECQDQSRPASAGSAVLERMPCASTTGSPPMPLASPTGYEHTQQQQGSLPGFEWERERPRVKGMNSIEMSGAVPLDSLPTFGGRDGVGASAARASANVGVSGPSPGGDVAAGGSGGLVEPVAELASLKKNIRVSIDVMGRAVSHKDVNSAVREFHDPEFKAFTGNGAAPDRGHTVVKAEASRLSDVARQPEELAPQWSMVASTSATSAVAVDPLAELLKRAHAAPTSEDYRSLAAGDGRRHQTQAMDELPSHSAASETAGSLPETHGESSTYLDARSAGLSRSRASSCRFAAVPSDASDSGLQSAQPANESPAESFAAAVPTAPVAPPEQLSDESKRVVYDEQSKRVVYDELAKLKEWYRSLQ